MKNLIKRTALTALLVTTCTLTATAFDDVSPKDWYYQDVTQMAEQGVINGHPDGTYRPQDPVTHAEFATLLSKAFYGDALETECNGTGFLGTLLKPRLTAETADQWWATSVAALGSEGIWGRNLAGMNVGYDYEYYVTDNTDWDTTWKSLEIIANQPITRRDVFTAMGQMFSKEDVKATYMADRPQMEDGKLLIDQYKATYTDWCDLEPNGHWATAVLLEQGIIKGSSATSLNANGTLTRGEIATIMARLLENPYLVSAPYQGATPTISAEKNPGAYNQNKYTVPADFNQDGILTEDEVAKMLQQLQGEFPEGHSLKDALGADGYTLPGKDGLYYWSNVLSGEFHGGDCIAWAFYVSDRIFGDLPVTRLKPGQWSEGDVRIGDVVEHPSHFDVAITNAKPDMDGDYFYSSTDSGSDHKVSWTPGSGTYLAPFTSVATIATRYPQ